MRIQLTPANLDFVNVYSELLRDPKVWAEASTSYQMFSLPLLEAWGVDERCSRMCSEEKQKEIEKSLRNLKFLKPEDANTLLSSKNGACMAQKLNKLASFDLESLEPELEKVINNGNPLPGDLETTFPVPEVPITTYDPRCDKKKCVRLQTREDFEQGKKYFVEGLKVLCKKEFCYVLLAAGHGSRMKIDTAKGLYRFEKLSPKVDFFDFHLKRILRLQDHINTGIAENMRMEKKDVKINIPVVIVVNEQYRKAIAARLANDKGLEGLNYTLITQTELPVLDLQQRKYIMDPSTNDSLLCAPCGPGIIHEDFEKSGLLKFLEHIGIKLFQINNIDNVLTLPADPYLVGIAAQCGENALLNVVVRKSDPDEKVGVLARAKTPYDNEHRNVLFEYSELPDELRNERDTNKLPLFSLANTGTYFMGKKIFKPEKLQVHIARKKMHVRAKNGEMETYNIGKPEYFNFDKFPLHDYLQLVLVDRATHFAPVKCLEGEDSVEEAVQRLQDYKTMRDTYAQLPPYASNYLYPGNSYIGE